MAASDMDLLSIFYSLYLRCLSLPLLLLLYIGGWKKAILRENAHRCGILAPFFRLRFYAHASLDFWRLVHGKHDRELRSRPQDSTKLKKLKSSPSLFVTAHFHHWELMGAWMASNGVPLLSAARPMVHPLSQALLLRWRLRLGLKTVHKDVPRQALRHLDQGGCFALLWDQRVARSPVRAPFFGSPLRVDPLPSFLLRHQSVPVWFGVLLPNGTFRLLLLSDPFSLSDPPPPERLARRYHRVLEFLIRRHPTWWYGLAHRRFLEITSGLQTSVSRETSAVSQVMVSRETKI